MGIIRGGIRSNQGISTTDNPTFVSLTLAGVNGLDVNPGSDIDADLITVGVTGTPKLWWDEATDSFEMNKSLTLPGGSLKIGTRIIAEDVIDNDGLETPGTLHVSASSGISANICLHEGTVPTVSASGDGHRIWVDSSNVLYHQDADGTSHKVISDDGSGNVGIGTTTPKQTFDFEGNKVRTQRMLDSDLNTNLGYESFGTALTGTYNNAFGRRALYVVTSGGNNSAVGSNALAGVTEGSNNQGMGYRAGDVITTGNHNINIGYRAGNGISTGSNNISFGSYTNYTGNYSNSVAIGYDVDPSADAGLNIGNLIYGTNLSSGATVSTGKVGIGDATPQEVLSVAGSADITGDIYTTAWTDYGGTSTVVGLSGTPTVNIWYKKIGNLVYVNYYINGNSNGPTFSFTVPYTNVDSTNANVKAPARVTASGSVNANSGMASLPANSNVVTMYSSWNNGGWSYSGHNNGVEGQFWYEAQ